MGSLLTSPEIELAEADHHAFNQAVWKHICADSNLAQLDFRIETDKYGQLIMSPPPAPHHSDRQGEIVFQLRTLVTAGKVLPECAISTTDGVKAADVAWCSDEIWNSVDEGSCFVICPEICIEVISPSNTKSEIQDKKRLYFEAGAKEVWLCNIDGEVKFYRDNDIETSKSKLFPDFPDSI